MKSFIATVLVLLFVTTFTFAQTKGDLVTLKVPLNYLEREGVRNGYYILGLPIFTGAISSSGDKLTVNGHTDWDTCCFPSLQEFTVDKVGKKRDKNIEYTEIEMINPTIGLRGVDRLHSATLVVKLRFMPPITTAQTFKQLTAIGKYDSPEMQAYLDRLYDSIGKQFFKGPLIDLEDKKKRTLLRFVHMTARSTRISDETYKGNLYMVIDLNTDDIVYNDLKLNQVARVATILNERLLNTLKAFAESVKDVVELQGLKMEMQIPHKSFLETSAIPQIDKLELYAPVDLIRKFAEADITNQQFIDGCTVIVNTNRIQVPLASQ